MATEKKSNAAGIIILVVGLALAGTIGYVVLKPKKVTTPAPKPKTGGGSGSGSGSADPGAIAGSAISLGNRLLDAFNLGNSSSTTSTPDATEQASNDAWDAYDESQSAEGKHGTKRGNGLY